MGKYEFVLSAVAGDLARIYELVQQGEDVDKEDALRRAAAAGHLHVVEYLVQNCRVDVNSQAWNGDTVLMKAAENGWTDVVRYLAEQCGANVQVRNDEGYTAAGLAAECGYHEIQRLLTQFVRPTFRRYTSDTAGTTVDAVYYPHDFALKSSCAIPPSEIELLLFSHHKNIGGEFHAKWLDADVVVKLFIPDSVHTSFTDQVHMWQQLRHPNVIKMYGASEASLQVQFFVCEYASKGSLVEYASGLVRNETVDTFTLRKRELHSNIWKYLYEAALGLAYLHERGIVHGNLRCSNILIGSDGLAKLSNFELSGRMTKTSSVSSRVVGSMRWQAPEILNRGPPSYRSDVYSLGMCILEAVTGKIPWSNQGDYRVRSYCKSLWAPERDAGSCFGPDCPNEDANKLVWRMCCQDKHKRVSLSFVIYELERLAIKAVSGFQLEYSTSFEDYEGGKMKDVWQKLENYMGKCDNNQYDQTFDEVKTIYKRLQVGTHHPILFARFRALLTEIYHTVRMSPEQARIMRLSSTRATTTSLYAMHWRIKSLRESLGVTCKNGFKERETQRRQQINEWVELLLSGTSDTYLLLKDLKSSEERSAFLKMLKTEIDNSAGKYTVSQLGVVKQAYKEIASTFDSNCDLAALTPEWFIPWYELIIDEWTQIGAGGFGSVYRAKWLDSDVVVKKVTLAGSDRKNDAMIFDPSQSGLSELLTSCTRSTTQNELKRAESLAMFRREVDIWFGFSHPHVVRLFGACHVGRPFFVCEYATNGTLVTYLRKNPDQLWTKLHEAALGVQYLHARNVVHGDLKGNNIVVGSDLKAKVTDFGLSSIANDETMPLVSGAWHWVAPECLVSTNTRPTFASDVYSLGMCIVEAMRVVEAVKAGKSIESCLPWRDQLNVVVKHHATKGTLPLRPTTCEDKQWELVKRMCTLEPHSRIKISTVVDMLAELSGDEDKKLANFPSKEIVDMESASHVIASAQRYLSKLQDDMEGEESLPVLSLHTSLWKYIEETHDRINDNDKMRTAFYSLVADAHASSSNVLEMKSSLITLTEVAMKSYSLRRRLDKLEEVREWAARWDFTKPTTAKCFLPSAVKPFGGHLLLDTAFVKLGFVVFVLFSAFAVSH